MMRWKTSKTHNKFVSRTRFALFPTECGEWWVWLESYQENFRWHEFAGLWGKKDHTRTPIFGPESDGGMD